jgi:xylitol oxidase
MDKRTFIKTSSVIAGGIMLSPHIGCKPRVTGDDRLSNWAGNLQYSTGNVHYPKTLDEVQYLVKGLNKCTALGSRHSFNKIADSNVNLISLQNLNKVVSLDRSSNTVTVEAGMTYGELSPYLHEEWVRIKQPGVTAAYHRGRSMRNGNTWLRYHKWKFIHCGFSH